MGVDTNMYVGPAIIFDNEERDVINKINSCPYKSCSNHLKNISTMYCSACGTETTAMERTDRERINLSKLVDAYENECEIRDSLQLDILGEYRTDKCITILNYKTELFSRPEDDRYAELDTLVDGTCMEDAKKDVNVQKFLAILDKKDIQYEFKMIAISFYS